MKEPCSVPPHVEFSLQPPGQAAPLRQPGRSSPWPDLRQSPAHLSWNTGSPCTLAGPQAIARSPELEHRLALHLGLSLRYLPAHLHRPFPPKPHLYPFPPRHTCGPPAWGTLASIGTAHASPLRGPPHAVAYKPAEARESSVQLRRSQRSHTRLLCSTLGPRGRTLCSTAPIKTALVIVPHTNYPAAAIQAQRAS